MPEKETKRRTGRCSAGKKLKRVYVGYDPKKPNRMKIRKKAKSATQKLLVEIRSASRLTAEDLDILIT